MPYDLGAPEDGARKSWLKGISPKTYWLFQAAFWFAVFIWRTSYTVAHGYALQGTGLRLVSMLLAFGITVLFTWIFLRFADEKLRPGKLALIVAAILLIGLGHTFIDRVIYTSAENNWQFAWPDVQVFFSILSVNMWVFVSWTGFFLMIHQMTRALAQQVTLVQLEKLAKETRLELLLQQLHPHFLFNTLNSLSALVMEGRSDDADAMIVKLSRFLRRSIDKKQETMATLEEEIAMIRDYLDIQAIRFSDRLQYEIDLDEDCAQIRVPRLILQPILENAVKHGIISAAAGGKISIAAVMREDRLHISVQDTGPGFPERPSKGRGMGLCIIRERLKGHYGDCAQIVLGSTPEGGASVTLWLPVDREVLSIERSAAA